MTATFRISQRRSICVSVTVYLMIDASLGRGACALCLSCHVLLFRSCPCIITARTKQLCTSQSTCSSYFCPWRSHWNCSALLPRQHERGCPLPPLLPLIFGAKDGHRSLCRHENIDCTPPLHSRPQAHVPLVGRLISSAPTRSLSP